MLRAGDVWIARGDYHMTVARKGTEVVVALNQDIPEFSAVRRSMCFFVLWPKPMAPMCLL